MGAYAYSHGEMNDSVGSDTFDSLERAGTCCDGLETANVGIQAVSQGCSRLRNRPAVRESRILSQAARTGRVRR